MRPRNSFVAFIAGSAAITASLFPSSGGAEAAGPYDCPTVFAGTTTEAQCTDHPETPHATEASRDEIQRAKTEAANVYARYRLGDATFGDVRAADALVNRLTGEVTAQRSILAATTVDGGGGAELREYLPFRQINSYYCGPATVQSMLWQLQSPERGVRAGDGEFLALTGDPGLDQPRLAGGRWLSTDTFGGTPWGDEFIPRTLNDWLGTHWYVSSGTPNVEGDLTQDQAMRNIQYAIDRGYPVAANLIYSSETYYPAGFYPGVTYSHWDTIYGYEEKDGRMTVNVGQVYGSEGLPYEPNQQVDWDTHWNAIGSWYGIVW